MFGSVDEIIVLKEGYMIERGRENYAFLSPQKGYGDGQGMQAAPGPSGGSGGKPVPGPKVIVEVDGQVLSERRLDRPVLTVGRLSGNDVQIPNQKVSRLHAKIRSEEGSWVIEDAESVNGIFYRGKRVEKLALTSGDSVAIAPGVVLRYQE
jgi:pSer/pThr/pTyr-binding forkhead associated (FHA) protein